MGLHIKTLHTTHGTYQQHETQKDIIKAESIMLFHKAISHYQIGTNLDLHNFLFVTFHRHRNGQSIRSDIFRLYKYIQKHMYSGLNITDRIAMIGFPEVAGTRSGPIMTNLGDPDHCHILIIARSKDEAKAIEYFLNRTKKSYNCLEWKYGSVTKGSLMHLLSYCLKTFSCDQQYHATGKFDAIVLPYTDARKGQKDLLDQIAEDRYSLLTPIPNTFTVI